MGAAVKGAVIRSQLNGLDLLEARQPVLDRLSPRTRARCEQLPSLVEWVPIEHSFEMARAVGAHGGDALLDRFGRAGGERLLATSFRPVIQGIFSVFGAEPHTLLARGELLMQAGFRDTHFVYRKLGERSAECEVQIVGEVVPIEYWRMWVGTMHHAYLLCQREGTVLLSPPKDASRASFMLEWK